MSALISKIQRFSIGDGPGIRSTVFFKGCSLGCLWCHNPECISSEPEPMHAKQLCARCFACERACPVDAISFADGFMRVDPARCTRCFACADACMYGALNPDCVRTEPDALIELLLKDEDYYHRSGGGVTFSGGEPLLGLPFIEQIMPALRRRGVHVAVETAGHVKRELFERALSLFDLIMMDIKLIDPEAHAQYTGADNRLILSNLELTRKADVPLLIRIPLIAGVNDTPENIDATIALLKGHPALTGVELLPYHAMGLDKAEQLVWTGGQRRFEPPGGDAIQRIADRFSRHRIPVQVESV